MEFDPSTAVADDGFDPSTAREDKFDPSTAVESDKVGLLQDTYQRIGSGLITGGLDSASGVARWTAGLFKAGKTAADKFYGEQNPISQVYGAVENEFNSVADNASYLSDKARSDSRALQDRSRDGTISANFLEAGGNFAGQVGVGALGKVPSLIANVGQLFQQEYKSAKEKGADDDTAFTAGVANMPAAFLDYFGESRLFKKLIPDGVAKTAKEYAKRLIGRFGLEGGTEVLQDEYSHWLAGNALKYDEAQAIENRFSAQNLAATGKAIAETFLIGGTLSTVASVGLDSFAPRDEESPASIAPQLEDLQKELDAIQAAPDESFNETQTQAQTTSTITPAESSPDVQSDLPETTGDTTTEALPEVSRVRAQIDPVFRDHLANVEGLSGQEKLDYIAQNNLDPVDFGIEEPPVTSEAPVETTPAIPEDVKKWIGSSKIVDESGNPLEVYHGTDADFNEFDIKKFGKTDPGYFGKGFYFTADPKFAKEFGGKIKKAFLKLENPLFIERDTKNSPVTDTLNAIEDQADTGIRKIVYDEAFGEGTYEQIIAGKTRDQINRIESDRLEGDMPLITKNINQILEREGFDGVIKTRKGKKEGPREIMVLSKDQIKSPDSPSQVTPSTSGEPISQPEAITAAMVTPKLQAKVGVLDRAAKTITGDWANAPEVVVVPNTGEIPETALSSQDRQAMKGNIDGLFGRDGKVYLVGSSVNSVQRAKEIILHETKGHFGLKGLFGDDVSSYDKAMKAAWTEFQARPALLNQIVQRGKFNSFQDLKNVYSHLDLATPEGRGAMAEELLARSAEIYLDPTKPRPTWFNSLISKIKVALQKVMPSMKLTDEDIVGLLSTHQKKLLDRASEAVEGTPAASMNEPVPVPPLSMTEGTGAFQGIEAALFSKSGETANAPTEKLRGSFKQIRDTAHEIKRFVTELPKFSDFKKVLLNWSALNQQSTWSIREQFNNINKLVPDKTTREAITNWIQAGGDKDTLTNWADGTTDKNLKAAYEKATQLTPEQVGVANAVKASYDSLRRKAEKYGIEINALDNYVNQIWNKGPLSGLTTTPKRISDFFRFSSKRFYGSFFEGEQAGLKPETKDIANLLGIYTNELNNAVNSRILVSDLSKAKASDGRPLVAPRGGAKVIPETDGNKGAVLVFPKTTSEETADYKSLDQPALQGWKWTGEDENGKPILVKSDLMVHPEAYTHLKNILGKSFIREWWSSPSNNPFSQLGKGATKFLVDDLQQMMKQTMLGFYSPFHAVQEGTHAIGHKVNPFFNIPEIDLTKPDQLDASQHGLMLSPDSLSRNIFMEGLGGTTKNLASKLAGKIPGVGPKIEAWSDGFQQWLFESYIPGLKLKTYDHILERNMGRFKNEISSGKINEDQVKNLSAQQANAAYGHLNYAEIGRNPSIQHIMQTFLLAPDFLEARGKFTAQALKPSKAGTEQLIAMGTLAAAFYIAARILNKLTDDDYHWDEPFEVTAGNRTYAMRSVPEDIYRLFKDSRRFVYGRLSPLMGRGIIEGLSGVNYRGEPTELNETLKNMVAGTIPLTLQPAVRGLTESSKQNPVSPLEQLMGAIGIQIRRYSPISQMYKLSSEWTEKHNEELGVEKKRGVYPVSKYSQLRYALEDGDFEKASQEIESLKKDQKLNVGEIAKGFRQSLFHPFTGSQKNDYEFKKSLSEDDKKMYDAAVKRRQVIYERFAKAIQQKPDLKKDIDNQD